MIANENSPALPPDVTKRCSRRLGARLHRGGPAWTPMRGRLRRSSWPTRCPSSRGSTGIGTYPAPLPLGAVVRRSSRCRGDREKFAALTLAGFAGFAHVADGCSETVTCSQGRNRPPPFRTPARRVAKLHRLFGAVALSLNGGPCPQSIKIEIRHPSVWRLRLSLSSIPVPRSRAPFLAMPACSAASPTHTATSSRRGAFTRTLAEHKASGTVPIMIWSHDQAQPIGGGPSCARTATACSSTGR